MSIAQWTEKHAAFTPHKLALSCDKEALSYQELHQRIQHTAQSFAALGIGRGDRVAILALNSSEYLVSLFACAHLGAMLAPLNWRLAPAELRYMVQDADAALLLVEASLHVSLPEGLTCPVVWLDEPPAGRIEPTLAALRDSTPISIPPRLGTLADPVLLVYTSGTTGRPKGAVLTQEALQVNALNSLHMHSLTCNDHVLSVLPFFHVGGLNIQTTPALYCGATVTIHARFDPDKTLKAICEVQPSVCVLVPTTMHACIQSSLWPQANLSSLRALATGSTNVPQTLSNTFRKRGVHVLEVYGSTETAPIAIYQHLQGEVKPDSAGLAGLHSEVQVVDEQGVSLPAHALGEVLIRGKHLMQGYWRNPTASAEALQEGWFYTGDIGLLDDEGHLFIKDRKKHMIISGGENIYPAEVERVLLSSSDILEAALIGLPDDHWGERAVAVVVVKETLDLEKIALLLQTSLARYKHPRGFVIWHTFPRNAMGKVQYAEIRKRLIAGEGSWL